MDKNYKVTARLVEGFLKKTCDATLIMGKDKEILEALFVRIYQTLVEHESKPTYESEKIKALAVMQEEYELELGAEKLREHQKHNPLFEMIKHQKEPIVIKNKKPKCNSCNNENELTLNLQDSRVQKFSVTGLDMGSTIETYLCRICGNNFEHRISTGYAPLEKLTVKPVLKETVDCKCDFKTCQERETHTPLRNVYHCRKADKK